VWENGKVRDENFFVCTFHHISYNYGDEIKLNQTGGISSIYKWKDNWLQYTSINQRNIKFLEPSGSFGRTVII
jgi:hypothetical protein